MGSSVSVSKSGLGLASSKLQAMLKPVLALCQKDILAGLIELDSKLTDDFRDELGSSRLSWVPYIYNHLVESRDRDIQRIASALVSALISNCNHYYVSTMPCITETMWDLFTDPDCLVETKQTCISVLWKLGPCLLEKYLDFNLIDKILDELQANERGKNSWYLEEIPDPSNSFCTSLLCQLSRQTETHKQFKKSILLDVIKPILNNRATNANSLIEKLKATVLLIFIAGRDENSKKHQIFFQITETTIMSLLKRFDKVLKSKMDELPGFRMYTFNCAEIVTACLNLSMSDNNKLSILNAEVETDELKFVNLLKKFLFAYIENKPQFGTKRICIGGGRDDHSSAALAVETLFQISFAYENDVELREKLFTSESGILEMLTLIRNNKPYLSDKAKMSVSFLLDRVTEPLPLPPLPPPQINTNNTANTNNTNTTIIKQEVIHSHVVLSYCSDLTADCKLVRQLRKHLEEQGYEVWTHDLGSSLVQPVRGGSATTLKMALNRAHTVIVCITKAYKLSANCRMEAMIARRLRESGTVKSIMFVMLEENYIPDLDTSSEGTTEESVDGWLGNYIANEPWTPLWQPEMVETASVSVQEQLVELAKNNPFISFNKPGVVIKPPPVVIKKVEEVVVKRKENEDDGLDHTRSSFEFVTHPPKSINHIFTVQTLRGMGVMDENDLRGLNQEDLLEVSFLIKKSYRAKFAAYFL